MAEPGCETSSEESLRTEEPTAADSMSPKQKQPRRGGRRRGRGRGRGCRRLVCRRHRRPDSFATYFLRVLKQVHQGLSPLQEAVSVMDSFIKDIFEHIADEASHLAHSTKCSTITTRDIQTAVRPLLPGEIASTLCPRLSKAVIRFYRRKGAASGPPDHLSNQRLFSEPPHLAQRPVTLQTPTYSSVWTCAILPALKTPLP
ncbi:late histone H2B.2.1-like [Zalophus californianus]|uniref:Late histone H2B.2.1-like n=1 Tax=Zalophus californianus TaxID=9704 RepID=A0A6J2ECI4_ZALCA|nr:late histone H2B.2.1-like [Zalophus californianus]